MKGTHGVSAGLLFFIILSGCGDVPASEGNEGPIVKDGGFEGGSPNADWSEYSTNFGTPICSVADCGTGGGTGPRQGTYWAFFGGTDVAETGSLSQNVTIPSGTAYLRFYLEIPSCVATGTDTFQVRIDGNLIYSATNTDAQCNVNAFLLHTTDVSTYANGATHELKFIGQFQAHAINQTNFMLDDVEIVMLP